jgi:hypothetical protein
MLPFTFTLSVALIKALPKIDGIINIMRNAIEKIFDSDFKINQYNWISKCISDEDKNISKSLPKPSQCRILASQHVVEGFIELLFCLLDTYGVRMTKFLKPISIKEHLTVYASNMLFDLFKVILLILILILNRIGFFLWLICLDVISNYVSEIKPSSVEFRIC